MFATLPPSAMRMELTRMVSGRLALPGGRRRELLASPSAPHGRAAGARHGRGRARRGRRSPPADGVRPGRARIFAAARGHRAGVPGARASPRPRRARRRSTSLEVDEHFSSELLRRAARHLRDGRPALSRWRARRRRQGGLEDDPELKALLAELIVQAGREEADPAMLEVQRLQLELARVDRQIQQARGQQDGDVSDLAAAPRARSSASSTAPTSGCSRRRGTGGRSTRRRRAWSASASQPGHRTHVARSNVCSCVPSQAPRRMRSMDRASLERFLDRGPLARGDRPAAGSARIDGRLLGGEARTAGGEPRQACAPRAA